MKSLAFLGALCLATGMTVSAASAQAPTSRAEFERLLGTVAAGARELAAAETERAQLTTDVNTYLADVSRHNAAPCTYPQGNPAQCAGYEAAKRELDRRRAALSARVDESDARLARARSHLSVTMSRLRLVSVLGELEPWRQQVVRCADMANAMAASACLDRQWQRVPAIRR